MTFSFCIIRQGPSCPSAGQPALRMSCWAPGRSHGLRTVQFPGWAGECATTRQADSARTRASTPRTARATTVVPAPSFLTARSAPTASTAVRARRGRPRRLPSHRRRRPRPPNGRPRPPARGRSFGAWKLARSSRHGAATARATTVVRAPSSETARSVMIAPTAAPATCT